MTDERGREELLRRSAAQVLAALVRRYGHFDACEDAVQEALVAASVQWARDGVPDAPTAWLIRVASRRLTDELRSESARRRREDAVAARSPAGRVGAIEDHEPEGTAWAGRDEDDSLTLLFLCCHPSLTPASQLALTLRAVGGLTTAAIAAALFVPEATMAQRISRAKQRIRDAGAEFVLPDEAERDARLAVVLQVLYLMFNEGYTTSSGDELRRADLTAEAIRLARMVHARLPDDGEVAGLLALMILTDARRAARTTATGALVPIPEQDRSRWDTAAIAEGVDLITAMLKTAPLGAYQVQAAIAAVHGESPSAEGTDWAQILALYRLLSFIAPGPMVTLNQAVAEAMVNGPAAGLLLVDEVSADPRLRNHHRVDSVRAFLLEMTGELDGAADAYRKAARRTTSLPEQRYLFARADRLATTRPAP